MPNQTTKTTLKGAGPIRIEVDGTGVSCHPGQSVAGALLAAGIYHVRRSPNALGPRGPFCMMGACQECVVRINGATRRACQTEVAEGLQVDLALNVPE